jgi:hypothetical protein
MGVLGEILGLSILLWVGVSASCFVSWQGPMLVMSEAYTLHLAALMIQAVIYVF